MSKFLYGLVTRNNTTSVYANNNMTGSSIASSVIPSAALCQSDGAIQVLSYNISGAVWQGGADGGLLIVDILRCKSDASPESLYLPNTPAGDTTPATLKYPVADTSQCIVIGRASLTVPPVAGNRPVLEVQKSGPTAGGAVKVDGTNSLLLVVHSVGFNTNTNLQVNVTGVVYIQ